MKHIDRGNRQLEEESFEAALKSFNKHLKKEGDHVLAFLGKAISYRKLGKYHESHVEFDLALGLSPTNPDLLSEKAVSYFQENKIEEAISFFDKARKIDPENPYRHSSLAYAQAKAGNMFEAIEHYEKAIQLDPEDAIAHNNLGLLKENIGHATKAQVHLKRSDDLIGRKSQKTEEQIPGNGMGSISTKNKISKLKDPSFKSKKFGSNFFRVLKGLFNSSEERKGFISFLKGYFNPSRDK